jgi:hypothetical protein
MVAKRSARSERTQAINQARALILTGPDELRDRFAGKRAPRLAEAIAALGPAPATPPATRSAPRCASLAGGWSSWTRRPAGWMT